MCFDSANLQETGAARKRAGGGRYRYGKRESKVREAGGSDPPVPPHKSMFCTLYGSGF